MSDFPKRITLELTNRCNLHCVFCPRRYMEKERGDMEPAFAFDLIDEMAPHKPALIPFFRGESLLHPQWDVILEHAVRKGVGPIQMATNASLLTEERARRIVDIGVDFLSFSMDTLDPERYRRLRGSDYTISLENVLRFLRLLDAADGQAKVQVSAVRTADNADEISRFANFWLEHVPYVRIYPEHSADGHPGSLAHPPLPRESRRPCHKVRSDMVITWNGEVALCNHDWTRKVTGQPLANVGRGGIAGAWISEAYQRVRQAHDSGNLSGIAPCEHCDHWAVSYLEPGRLGELYVRDAR